MELDAALRLLGNRYQIVLYLVLNLTLPLSAFVLMGMVFMGSKPTSFYCTPPPGFEPNETVPGFGGPEIDSCQMYEVHDGMLTGNTTYCKHGWTYETDFGETTIIMDFDLVCDNAILVKVVQSILMCGVMIGSITSGQLSDYIGRRPVMYIFMLSGAASAMGTAWVDNYFAFLVFYFFLGVSQQGILNSSFVMISEMFAPELRTYAVSMTSVTWGMAVSFVTPVAYLLPNWRHFQLFTSLIHLAVLPTLWFVPESTRWLISRGRMDEAEDNLRTIARFNGVDARDCYLKENVRLVEIQREQEKHNDINKNKKYSPINHDKLTGSIGDNVADSEYPFTTTRRYYATDVFKSAILLRSFLILAFCWFTNSIVYYGLSINSALIPGNKYLNVFLICFVEFPSGIIMVLGLKWIGRRPSLSGSFFFGGICCMVVAYLPQETESGTNLSAVIIAISTIGKFWVSFSFSMSYVFSPEIMPTVIRQVTLGGCSFFARIGGVLAPFILYLGDVNVYIPLTLLGACAFISGVICLILPETRNKPLPETIEEGEERCRRIYICSNCRRA